MGERIVEVWSLEFPRSGTEHESSKEEIVKSPSASVLILNPLSHMISCTKCVAYFYEEVPGIDAFGVNYGNTNNFLENPSKRHRINILPVSLNLSPGACHF
jgi:hypothetical protein